MIETGDAPCVLVRRKRWPSVKKNIPKPSVTCFDMRKQTYLFYWSYTSLHGVAMQFVKRKHEVVLSEGQRKVKFLGMTQSQSRLTRSDAEPNSSQPKEGRGSEREMQRSKKLHSLHL